MTFLEAYAVFGVPAVFLGIGGMTWWIVGRQDRRERQHASR
ncbi:hypothetical protein ACFOD4_05435 [Pseudoroseomonas globiformis]|uniref:Uncharacterized protein n=1 Tax=Teichococcus globiformis TaxID=2307229 RepID=A0ABV7FXZ2_9PROT